MRRLFSILIAILLIGAFVSYLTTKPRLSSDAIINTPQGMIQGVTTDRDGIYGFKGIPYAVPPVDDRRWRAPAPAPKWGETRTADTFGHRCLQNDTDQNDLTKRLIRGQGFSKLRTFLTLQGLKTKSPGPMSEDCLYLNVYTGNLSSSEAKQPVMVWLHGGGHQFGAGSFDYYQSSRLPSEGVVLVTLNYRLGAFGYMAHPTLSADSPQGVSGNYGTLDQIQALKWVRDNISAYGGDPDNVTIFGESAGAWSVTEMMASPLAKGLFHKAISQSGAATYLRLQMEDEAYEAGERLIRAVGLPNPTAAEIRDIHPAEVLGNPEKNPPNIFTHIRDGYVFPKNVGQAFRDGDMAPVPYMAGFNADEGTLFMAKDDWPSFWNEQFPSEPAALKTRLEKLYPGQAENLMAQYKLAEDYWPSAISMMGDDLFGVNVRFAARQHERAGHPSWLYHFSRIPMSETQTFGAFHAAELPFVFDTHESLLGVSEQDRALTDIMVTAWTNFAKNGNPNGANLTALGVPNWPQHQGQNWLELSANTGRPLAATQTGIRAEKLGALETGLIKKLDATQAKLDAAIAAQTDGAKIDSAKIDSALIDSALADTPQSNITETP